MVGVAASIATLLGLPLGVFLATSGEGELFAAPAVDKAVGGIANPLEVIEQITRLLFIRGLRCFLSAPTRRRAIPSKPPPALILNWDHPNPARGLATFRLGRLRKSLRSSDQAALLPLRAPLRKELA